ncbi:hypothetical protein AVEN_82934-1 [Araneus ventricosus]|uniref:DNA-directed DNA polymerase n=1 Tax=Araneus ventricosus TaxID=182803 RepID=A0A4Y2CVX3_ARAVE|nr:hypothetical protein AVEN_82934-1 [Araneus ventricosus]
MCEQPLELFTYPDMHLMIENGIRGGISMITHRFAQSNNKYLPNYDSNKPSTYILYLDANNLYGWAMSQPLPYGNFEWISSDGIDSDWILSIVDDGEVGYVFEVDLSYPHHLHDDHNEYPLAPEKLEICKEMLSPYSREHAGNTTSSKIEKLTPNLNDKKNYVTLIQNLKFYLKLGLKLTAIHKILKFEQKPWLKRYIEFNTNKRINATSLFEKNLFKLMNNAVYGKTMENVRKHKDISLINNNPKAEKLVASPTFRAFSIFNDNLVGVERLKKTVWLNKPLYVGFAILELSKLHMYKFHYEYIKQRYGNKSKLLFTDTDSLTYHTETEDIYKDMMENAEIFDTSDYPVDHPLYSIKNKKKIGCFKDETNSECIVEFIGLRSKMYSILTKDYEKKTAKGITKTYIQKNVKHQDYKNCLLNSAKSRGVQSRIQSFNHNLYSMKINKVTLSSFDDKRYILDDGVESFAYGHYKI